jgi:hypothetical protein
VQVGTDLIQFEVTTLEEIGFFMCKVHKGVIWTLFANESKAPCNQPTDLEAWLKNRNNKPIW